MTNVSEKEVVKGGRWVNTNGGRGDRKDDVRKSEVWEFGFQFLDHRGADLVLLVVRFILIALLHGSVATDGRDVDHAIPAQKSLIKLDSFNETLIFLASSQSWRRPDVAKPT